MKKLKILLGTIFLLSMFDMLATSIGIQKGYIIEANPIMKSLWNTYFHLGFYFIKISTTIFALIVFYMFYMSKKKIVKYGINISIGSLCFVFIIHLRWILSVIIINHMYV